MKRHRVRIGIIAGAVVVAVGIAALSQTDLFHDHVKEPVRHAAHTVYAVTAINPRIAGVATISQNLRYCGSDNRDQELDLYRPKAPSRPTPLVVFIHGGGWSSGDKADPIIGSYGPAMVKQGYALASVNYRLGPRTVYPAQNQDVACALTYLHSNAARYRLDPQRFALFGASAGGQLALYAALAPASQNQSWQASVRGVIDFYGVADLTHSAPGTHLNRVIHNYLGSGYPRAEMAASPQTYANQTAPPMLIFHGTKDPIVPFAQSVTLQSSLASAGNQATLIPVVGAHHGFGGRGTSPSVATIRQDCLNFLGQIFTNS